MDAHYDNTPRCNILQIFMTVKNDNFEIITKTCPCNKQQIFHGCKKDNFQMKNCDIFLIFAQNIDSLEPPH